MTKKRMRGARRREKEGSMRRIKATKGNRGACMLVKVRDSPAGPRGTVTTNVASSPPRACRQEFNAGSNVWTAQQEMKEEGIVGEEILSPPSSCQTQACVWLCCCCHLRDTSASSKLHTSLIPILMSQSHIQTHDFKLTDRLCYSPLRSIRSQEQACPHIEAFGRTPSYISLLPPWLNQAGGEEKSNKKGRGDCYTPGKQQQTSPFTSPALSLHTSFFIYKKFRSQF